jgi:hypothetical protein
MWSSSKHVWCEKVTNILIFPTLKFQSVVFHHVF